MQYERNDTIIYDEGFKTSAEKEYCISEEADKTETDDMVIESKINKYSSNSIVLITQLIICILCTTFLFVSKTYFSDIYSVVREKLSFLLNDSLIIDGNDLSDFFVDR